MSAEGAGSGELRAPPHPYCREVIGMDNWSPFDRNGNLALVLSTDSRWRRLWARLRGKPIWHNVGALREDDR